VLRFNSICVTPLSFPRATLMPMK